MLRPAGVVVLFSFMSCPGRTLVAEGIPLDHRDAQALWMAVTVAATAHPHLRVHWSLAPLANSLLVGVVWAHNPRECMLTLWYHDSKCLLFIHWSWG